MGKYDDKIKDIEAELSKMQYNKHTQAHYGLLRAKISRLREAQAARSGVGKASGKGYSVKKSGSASVILIGFPSAGKSTLLNALTGADSPVGAYEFTTLDVIPGMMSYKHANIQILDVPGIVRGAASGRGRGREVLAVMRSADLALIIIDVNKPEQLATLQKEIYDSGLRLNQRSPDVRITKKPRGGLNIANTVRLTKLTKETAKAVLRELSVHNADVVIRTNIDVDQFIDCIEANKVFIPAAIILNKMDTISPEKLEDIQKQTKADICISANDGTNIPRLRDLIYDKLGLIRIYCKEVGKKADLDVPLIIRKGSTVRTVCDKLHREFVSMFKFSKVWGSSAKFGGQKLMLKHKVKDGDIVELHLR